ncbi:(2Fe-2S)-binding protein [Paenibacillus psychroresistens]|nr:(2Fe-2S)-binding protein [Paenibacillus psychroresistens]
MEETMDLAILEAFFHISPTGMKDPVLSIPAIDLLNKSQMDAIVRLGMELYKGKGLDVGASFIGKSFFNLCASLQIVLATNNRFLDLSLENLTFEIESHGDHAHTGFKINQLRWKEVPEVERQAWLTEEFKAYFKNTINPVIELTALSANVKPDLIWNQFGGSLAYGVDYIIEHEKRQDVIDRYREVYDLIANQLPPETFNRKKNPFNHKPKYVDNPYNPGTTLMIRSACCLLYRCEGHDYCHTCPRMRPEEREEQRLKILETVK